MVNGFVISKHATPMAADMAKTVLVGLIQTHKVTLSEDHYVDSHTGDPIRKLTITFTIVKEAHS